MLFIHSVPSLRTDGAVSEQSMQSASGFVDALGTITEERHTPNISSVSWDKDTSNMMIAFKTPFNGGFPYFASCYVYDSSGVFLGILLPIVTTPTQLTFSGDGVSKVISFLLGVPVTPVTPNGTAFNFALVVVGT